MTEQKKMDQDTYNDIASKQDNYWEKNVVMLRKAIQHIDDKEGTLWKEIMPLLPGEQPKPTKEKKTLVGLEVIIIVRDYLKGSGYFETTMKNNIFSRTYEWESKHEDDLGYTDDGFRYSHSETKLKMTWVNSSDKNTVRLNCFEEFDSSPDYLHAIAKNGKVEPTYEYINGVDHFYTKLIWNVVSGVHNDMLGCYALGIFYTVADILGHEIKAYESTISEIKPSLKLEYNKMLDTAAKEAKKAKEA